MNTNYLKCRQVILAGNHQNKSVIKKTKSEEIGQSSCSGNNENMKGVDFSKFCQDNARKCFKEKTLQSSNFCINAGN